MDLQFLDKKKVKTKVGGWTKYNTEAQTAFYNWLRHVYGSEGFADDFYEEARSLYGDNYWQGALRGFIAGFYTGVERLSQTQHSFHKSHKTVDELRKEMIDAFTS